MNILVRNYNVRSAANFMRNASYDDKGGQPFNVHSCALTASHVNGALYDLG